MNQAHTQSVCSKMLSLLHFSTNKKEISKSVNQTSTATWPKRHLSRQSRSMPTSTRFAMLPWTKTALILPRRLQRERWLRSFAHRPDRTFMSFEEVQHPKWSSTWRSLGNGESTSSVVRQLAIPCTFGGASKCRSLGRTMRRLARLSTPAATFRGCPRSFRTRARSGALLKLE